MWYEPQLAYSKVNLIEFRRICIKVSEHRMVEPGKDLKQTLFRSLLTLSHHAMPPFHGDPPAHTLPPPRLFFTKKQNRRKPQVKSTCLQHIQMELRLVGKERLGGNEVPRHLTVMSV